MTTEVLKNVGFRDIGRWEKGKNGNLKYELDLTELPASGAIIDVRNALYAFIHGDWVMYIGKTARSIRRRFVGYCSPGKTQQTNIRCHRNIQELLAKGIIVRILVCTPPSELQYCGFQIDLAAGLEESLILRLAPPWNGAEAKRPITEEAEREKSEESAVGAAQHEDLTDLQPGPSRPVTFPIRLGKTYYNQGFINPGVEASEALGQHDDPVIIYLGSETEQVDSFINRTANKNGSVRIIGDNASIAKWFQKHFQLEDEAVGEVRSPNRILLRSKERSADEPLVGGQ